ncbi:MAG: hypothetical protein ACLP9L_41540, partial [Thermoguttaceae bacterium]
AQSCREAMRKYRAKQDWVRPLFALWGGRETHRPLRRTCRGEQKQVGPCGPCAAYEILNGI